MKEKLQTKTARHYARTVSKADLLQNSCNTKKKPKTKNARVCILLLLGVLVIGLSTTRDTGVSDYITHRKLLHRYGREQSLPLNGGKADNFWTQLGHDIDGTLPFENSGFSVSLSKDGSTVAIGAPNSASVRVSRCSNTVEWAQLGSYIVGEPGDALGREGPVHPSHCPGTAPQLP